MSAPTSTASSPSLSTWLSQHRRLVVAVAAAITVSTAGALYYSHSAQQARQAEQKQQKQAKKDAKKGKKTPPPTTTAAEKPKASSSESSSDGAFELPLYRHRSKLTPTPTRRRFEAVGDRHRSHGRSGEYARADLAEKPTDNGKETDPIADGAGLEGARQQALRLEAV